MVDKLKKLRKGYEKGNVEDAFNLGQVYFLGLLGQNINYSLAFKTFMFAAEQNHVLALSNVGYCYEFGLGTQKNLSKAEEYYKQAVELGSLTAKCNLLHLYETEQLKADKQYDYLQEYKILALKDDVRAKYKVGKILGRKNTKNALPYLKPIAEKGYVPAQVELFNLYYNSLVEDYSKELNYWANKLLEVDYPMAYYVKGKNLIYGESQLKDVTKGLELLKKGAKLGDKRCCLVGGLCYYNGEVIGRNYKKALEFFEIGVKLGCEQCAGYASKIYGVGLEVKKDKNKAFKYGVFSASEGESIGYLALAKCHQYGYGTNIDYEQVYNNLCNCEENEENDFTWGWLYQNGFYLKKSLKRAGEQYRSAFTYKYNNFFALGVYLSFSIEYFAEVQQNETKKHEDFFRNVLSYALDKGYTEIDTFKAVCYLKGVYFEKNIELGKAMLKNNADKGLNYACLYMYEFLLKGEFFDKDVVLAVKYLKDATKVDTTGKAMHLYGYHLYNGIGVEKNQGDALTYYLASAMLSYVPSFCVVAKMWYNGEGCCVSKTEALKWYVSAAKANDLEAIRVLGRWYITGDVVEKDIDYGILLTSYSAENGHIPAVKDLLFYYEQPGVYISEDVINKVKKFLQ